MLRTGFVDAIRFLNAVHRTHVHLPRTCQVLLRELLDVGHRYRRSQSRPREIATGSCKALSRHQGFRASQVDGRGPNASMEKLRAAPCNCNNGFLITMPGMAAAPIIITLEHVNSLRTPSYAGERIHACLEEDHPRDMPRPHLRSPPSKYGS